jgi:hypothetical protein
MSTQILSTQIFSTQICRASILFILGVVFTSLSLVFVTHVITNIPLVLENSRSVLKTCPNVVTVS